MAKLVILTSILFIHITTQDKFIELIDQHYDDSLYLDMFLGQPQQDYQLQINTNKITSFINSDKFNQTQSTSGTVIEMVPQIINNTVHNTIKYSDKISFENNESIDNFLFYIVNGTEYLPRWDEGIAFGYSFNDTAFSFIHLLYQQQLISHKKFGFVLTKTRKGKRANIFLGSIPLDRLTGYQYNTSLNVKHEQIEWNVCMKKVKINKKYLHLTNTVVIVNTAQFYMVLHNEIFDLFCDTVLSPYLQNKTCERFDEVKRSYVKCYDKNIVDNLGMINFYFDNNQVINMNITLFFKCFGNLCFSYIGGDTTKQGTFEVGYNFLKIFNATEFDYENGKIHLYSDTFTFNKEYNNSLITIITLSVSLMCMCMCIVIYISKRINFELQY